MTKIHINAAGLRNLLQQARQAGTVDSWCPLALEWMESATARIAALEARLAEARKDAERYRWLFRHDDSPMARVNHVYGIWDGYVTTWDGAVDTARKATELGSALNSNPEQT